MQLIPLNLGKLYLVEKYAHLAKTETGQKLFTPRRVCHQMHLHMLTNTLKMKIMWGFFSLLSK